MGALRSRFGRTRRGRTQPLVAVLAVSPASGAATRLRALQYRDGLAAEGIGLELWSFLREGDLAYWYGRSQLRRAFVALKGLWRVFGALMLIRRATVVLVQREAMPLGPPILEKLAARRRPLIWDVDDAVWQPYISPTAGRVPRWLRATGNKYRRICHMANEVWAGSEVLAEWCRHHNDKVRVIPTVVVVPDQRPEPGTGRTAIWIGSHSTGPFLADILPALAASDAPPDVLAVGARVTAPDDLNLRVQDWSLAAEEEALSSGRIGLYPIDRAHPLAEGKCALKAILYMSRGVPPVVTPTTTNARIVRHEIEGLHADSPAEWASSVRRLLDDGDLWERLSRASHQRVLAEYSLQRWAPKVAEYVRALVDAGRNP